jgi:hypothetical protein
MSPPQRENIPGGLLGMFPEDDVDLVDKKKVQSQCTTGSAGKIRSPESKYSSLLVKPICKCP